MSEITKEELLAMIEVQSKTASAMENIANSIRQIYEQNKELVKSQSEIVKNFTEEREQCTAQICTTLKEGIKATGDSASINKATIDKIRDDTFWTKIILGSVALIASLALLITQFIHWVSHKGG